MKYSVRKTVKHDCLVLSKIMREVDKQEIWSAGRFTPTSCLHMSLEISGEHSYALKLDGEVVGIFGVAPCKERPDIGIVWLMGADNMTEGKKGFYKVSQEYLKKFLEMYKTVFNYVDERNVSSSKWLESLGFKNLGTEPKFGVDEIPFNLYVKERDNV